MIPRIIIVLFLIKHIQLSAQTITHIDTPDYVRNKYLTLIIDDIKSTRSAYLGAIPSLPAFEIDSVIYPSNLWYPDFIPSIWLIKTDSRYLNANYSLVKIEVDIRSPSGGGKEKLTYWAVENISGHLYRLFGFTFSDIRIIYYNFGRNKKLMLKYFSPSFGKSNMRTVVKDLKKHNGTFSLKFPLRSNFFKFYLKDSNDWPASTIVDDKVFQQSIIW